MALPRFEREQPSLDEAHAHEPAAFRRSIEEKIRLTRDDLKLTWTHIGKAKVECVSEDALVHLKSYKYSSVDKSPISYYILRHYVRLPHPSSILPRRQRLTEVAISGTPLSKSSRCGSRRIWSHFLGSSSSSSTLR